MVNLIIAGIAGRMGQRIYALAQSEKQFRVVYGLESPKTTAKLDGVRIGADPSELKNAHVVIDFTIPEATSALLMQALKYKTALVIGTTGFSAEQDRLFVEAAKAIPIVKSANMSMGVNVFFKTAQNIARALPDYSVNIIETHHIHKKDAPSGTALQAGKLIENVSKKKVVYESLREGEVIGDHKIIFTGPSDKIELFHHAESRDLFASGALVAAQWIAGKNPGLYSMWDVLGLS